MPLDGVRVARCPLGEWSEGSGLPEGAVWPVIVVVAFELVQHGCGVSLVDDQEAVEEFAADRPDKALGDRIRPRGAGTGVLMILTSMAVKTASNAAVNLLSRSRMRNRKPVACQNSCAGL